MGVQNQSSAVPATSEVKVLQVALQEKRYDLAAHAIVLALIKLSRNGTHPNVSEKEPPQQAQPLP